MNYRLHRLVPSLLAAFAIEALVLYAGHGSSFWRTLLFPAHFVLGTWAVLALWSERRGRGTGNDRRHGDRRSAPRPGV